MVATKVLISLCVCQLAVAAPQLLLPGVVQRTATTNANEEQIVTNVVTALQPSIAEAVARALASFQTSSVSSTGFNSGSVSSSGINSGSVSSSGFNSGLSSSGFNSGSVSSSGFNSGLSSSSGSGSSFFEAEKNAFENELRVTGVSGAVEDVKPEYNFEFKVADDEQQTYISQQEARDGDQLTGTYSYVDPEGALITVNYQAGPMGYTQTLDKQEGFVSIRAQPVRNTASNSASSSSSSASSFNTGSSSTFSSGSGFNGGSSVTSVNTASALDESALIAQIVSALQPSIQASVNSALASQQQTSSVTASRVVSAPVAVPVAAPAAGGSVTSLFGDGYNVRIATPEFNIEY